MSVYEDVQLEGHIIDSLILPRALDDILDMGGDFQILDVRVGRGKDDHSRALLRVIADDEELLEKLLLQLQRHGAEPLDQSDARLEPAPADGVFPESFYSTTNLDTFVRVEGRWLAVEHPEMDCGIMVDPVGLRAWTAPLVQVRGGDLIVTGSKGLRAIPLARTRKKRPFEFMGSAVSSEKPYAS
jgi:hypothetical protein